MTTNILITGGAGYIGSHISEILIKKKKKIFIVDNLSTGHRRLIIKKAKFFKVNINNKKKISTIIKKHKIDSIIHLAASLIIGEGEKHPKKYFQNNVISTQKLLSACKNTTVRNFLFSSTAAVYKEGPKKVTEKSSLKPKSVYGKTKLLAEKNIIKFCRANNINYGILRYFNIVGSSSSGKIGLVNKGDSLFKNFSEEILKKKPVLKIYGTNYPTKDGSCIRDFIHVTDIAEIHSKVLNKIDKIRKSKILNCGYSKGISVKEVAKKFSKYGGKNVEIKSYPRRKGDLIKMIAITTNLRKFIKWKPKFISLEKMVKSSIRWEKNL